MTLAIAHGAPLDAPPYPTVRDAILRAVETMPEGRFIHANGKDEPLVCLYADTLARALGLAEALTARGMQAGDGLLIHLRASDDFVPALWAAMIAGFVAIPLARSAGRRFGSQASSDILGFVRTALGPARLLTDDEELAAAIPSTIAFRDLAPQSGAARPKAPSDVPDVGTTRLVILTSGATGRPKLVGLSERAVLSRWWPKMPDAAHANAFLSWSPFDHIMGLSLAAPNIARKIHLDADAFAANPLSWLDLAERAEATHATMTNFSLSLIVEALRAHPGRTWRLDNIRKIGVGAEQISGALCRQFLDRLRPFGLRQDAIILGYGLTECGPVVGGANAFAPEADAADGAVVLDEPTPGHALRIVGEDGSLLSEGEDGRIEVTGPTMTSGYVGDAEETGRLFTRDGWLRTGDLGRLDGGRLTVIGRERELVFVNARKYSCQEIESAVVTATRFDEVYATPLDPAVTDGAGKPFALFVAVENVRAYALDEVADETRRAIARAYRFAPHAVALIERRDVPRTGLGKVQRFALAAKLNGSELGERVHRLGGSPAANGAPRQRGDIEAEVAAIWERLLNRAGVDRNADFFVVGGDSVLALQLSFELEQRFGRPLPFETFPDRLSVAEIARFLSSPNGFATDAPSASIGLPVALEDRLRAFTRTWPGEPAVEGGYLRKVGAATAGIPVFWCMQTENEATNFGAVVGAKRPAFAMRSGHLLLDYGTPAARALSDAYANEILNLQPDGPFVLAGTCQGGIVALDIARKFLAEGRDVRLLVLADMHFFEVFNDESFAAPVAMYAANRSKFNPYRKFRYPTRGLAKLLPGGGRQKVLPGIYGKIMVADNFPELAADLEEAIVWAATARRLPDAGVFSDESYHQEISSPSAELSLKPGEAATVTIEVLNRGPVAWEPFEASGLSIGNHWLTPEGELLIWSDGRAPIEQTIRSGESRTLSIPVTAPAQCGRFLLEIDMVEEGVRWFGDKAYPPLHIPVVVAERFELNEAVRSLRRDIRALPLPRWRRQSASMMLSLAKRLARPQP